MSGNGVHKRAEALLETLDDLPAKAVLKDLLAEVGRLNARLEKISRISDRYQAELRDANKDLSQALAEVKTLQGFVPICAKCKRIRDDQGFWEQVESYLGRHSNAIFSHGVCPECARELFPNAQAPVAGKVEPSRLVEKGPASQEQEALEDYLRSLGSRPPGPLLLELQQSVRAHLILLRRFSKIVRVSDGFQSELKRLNNVLAETSRTDALTGLLNRRGMMKRLNAELARSARTGDPVSVLMLDVDQFKVINDTYGHEAGDRVLRTLSDQLQSCLRDYDSSSRWGGEEFLVLLPGTQREAATLVGEKVRSRVAAQKIEVDGVSIGVTLCVGIAQWQAGESLASLLRRADDACYFAKQQGRNRSHADS